MPQRGAPSMAAKRHVESGAGSVQPARDDPWADAPLHLQELLTLASDLARDAGQVHAEGMRSALRIETKSSPTDLVSQVDRESERMIVERLSQLRPDDAVLGEEGALGQGTSGVRWVIDPLDGTTNYVYGYPAFAVSIAVEIEGQPQIGVVYDSSAGRLYRAINGFAAACDDQPIHVREQPDLSTALVATGFSYEAAQRERQGSVVAQVLGRVRDIRRGGTAALDLCHVAAGHVDAYWELDLSPWDYAAGSVIARASGGIATTRARGSALGCRHDRTHQRHRLAAWLPCRHRGDRFVDRALPPRESLLREGPVGPALPARHPARRERGRDGAGPPRRLGDAVRARRRRPGVVLPDARRGLPRPRRHRARPPGRPRRRSGGRSGR